jgi:DNA-damage-inducible protein J
MKGVVFMAQTVNVNFKLDADVKKSMEQACSDMGLSMSAAFTIFAKKVGRERRIPFEISADPFYSESNIRYLEQKMADYKAGKIKLAEHELIEE